MNAIATADITGLVLAGGRGSRMGGVDKGLQLFHGQPLALHALERLRGQAGRVAVNANRNLAAYEAFGAPVWPDDALPDYPGPLAGFLAGLERCETSWLLTVPCDTPMFPDDLAARLASAVAAEGAEIAIASAPDAHGDEDGASEKNRDRDGNSDGSNDGTLRSQPVFCLLRADLKDSLRRFVESGGRKVGQWTASHRLAIVPFDRPGDAADAFFNANTLAELHALEGQQA